MSADQARREGLGLFRGVLLAGLAAVPLWGVMAALVWLAVTS